MYRHIFLSALLSVPLSACPAGDEPLEPDHVSQQVGGAGEGSAEAPPVDPTAPVVTSIRIQPRGFRIAPGRPPERVTAAVYDQNREPMDVEVEWHSLDPETVSINERGEIIALGPLGPAFVTATAGDVIAEQIPIYVVDPARLPLPDEGSGEEAAANGSTVAPSPSPVDGSQKIE